MTAFKISVQPSAYFTPDNSADFRKNWTTTLLNKMRIAVVIAEAAGITLEWREVLARDVPTVPVLHPDSWLMRFSSAFRWLQDQRTHQEDTIDCFLGRDIVASPYQGYAPRNVGWFCMDFAGAGVLLLHEIGHRCGLAHVEDPTNVMCKSPLQATHFEPWQVEQMRSSRWALPPVSV